MNDTEFWKVHYYRLPVVCVWCMGVRVSCRVGATADYSRDSHNYLTFKA